MFGYVRPLTPELRVRELEMYKALYCGVCYTLGKRYGLATRFILSYDFVFLCSLLWEPDEKPCIEKKRCPASLRRKRCVCNQNAATERAAGYGVILAYHKLRDNLDDEGFFKATAARLAMLWLSRAYKKARRDYPEFDSATRLHLDALATLEKGASDEPISSPDAFANAFALLLAEAAKNEADETRRRIFESLLYHLGRWLYYADARDDLADDITGGKPNPLKPPNNTGSKKIDDDALRLTMNHSNSLASAAFELLPETAWSELNRNVLYLGLPSVLDSVFDTDPQRRERRKRRPVSGYRNI